MDERRTPENTPEQHGTESQPSTSAQDHGRHDDGQPHEGQHGDRSQGHAGHDAAAHRPTAGWSTMSPRPASGDTRVLPGATTAASTPTQDAGAVRTERSAAPTGHPLGSPAGPYSAAYPPYAAPATGGPGHPGTGQPHPGAGGPAPRRRRRGTALVAACLLLAVAGGVGGGAGWAALTNDSGTASGQTAPEVVSSLDDGSDAATSSTSNATPSGEGVEGVAADVLPSVVSITVRSGAGEGSGTGVVLSSDGQILTNNHVVAGAGDGGTVQVLLPDGSVADAEVLGTDPLTDLAVIQADDVSGLTPATLGSSADLQVGEQVVAIGSPLGLDGTVTTGIISAMDRVVTPGEQAGGQTAVIDALQTDAPINPGNSGGPLVNMDGEVIGINSAIVTGGAQSTGSIGLGFAIPVDQARPIAQELVDSGRATHARIGIGVADSRGDTPGAEVAEVEDGGSAQTAGLETGDVITRIDDRIVPDATTLIAAARSYRPGDEVELTYTRGGSESTVTITLGSDASTT